MIYHSAKLSSCVTEIHKKSIDGCSRLVLTINQLMKELECSSCVDENTFDQCLWEILTVPTVELQYFVDNCWTNTLNKLPISILYLIQDRLN